MQGTSRGGADIKEIVKRIDMWAIDMVFVVGGNGGNAGAQVRLRACCSASVLAGACAHSKGVESGYSKHLFPCHYDRSCFFPDNQRPCVYAVCSAGCLSAESVRHRMETQLDYKFSTSLGNIFSKLESVMFSGHALC